MNKERLNALKEQIKRFNFQFVLDVIEELEKENKEQKAQIEKMRSCHFCIYTNIGDFETPCINCKNYDKWEFSEND